MITPSKIDGLKEAVVTAVNKAASHDILDEAAVTEMVSTIIKTVLNNMYTAAMNMYRKAQEFYKSAKERVARFGRTVYNDIMSRRQTRPSSPVWNKMVMDMARHKSESEGYDAYFELYKWDDRYIESLPDKMEKFDNLRFAVNGKSVTANTDSLIQILQDALVNNKFDLGILKHYEEEIGSEYSKVFQTRSNKPNGEEILHRAGMTDKLRVNITPRLVEDMIRAIETQPDVLYNISVQYKRLANEYKAAEKTVDSVRADNIEFGKTRTFLNMIQSILTAKNIVFNTIQSAHIKIMTSRSSEYMKQILAYVNV